MHGLGELLAFCLEFKKFFRRSRPRASLPLAPPLSRLPALNSPPACPSSLFRRGSLLSPHLHTLSASPFRHPRHVLPSVLIRRPIRLRRNRASYRRYDGTERRVFVIARRGRRGTQGGVPRVLVKLISRRIDRERRGERRGERKQKEEKKEKEKGKKGAERRAFYLRFVLRARRSEEEGGWAGGRRGRQEHGSFSSSPKSIS